MNEKKSKQEKCREQRALLPLNRGDVVNNKINTQKSQELNCTIQIHKQ